MLDIISVSKKYQSQMALHDVTFSLSKGEFAFIMGHSGSGKSTLLKMVYGACKPTSGRVILFNKDVAKLSPRYTAALRRKLGIVFQDYKLIQSKTVWENIAFALEVQGASYSYIKRKVAECLEFVGLNLRSRDFPHMLSGGEQQRVGIARALVNNPQLLLADEPTGNLDFENSKTILSLLGDVNNMGTSVLVATHDKEIVSITRKRLIKLDHGQLTGDGNAH
ncbi:MAG TPA: cell division ATP-binding protein FtsE [Caldisericia bacterium]|nr:cell division ATP-binding protein FtsE [Caldisericia bacterium]HPF48947.1 cell division ATP-binding protein FtsE [Caldisericia bacterium]HPI83189.1 cell division ATP-binding protein FtsE [Caldisericia bacterium]HPQ92416.1 cell division ATP-binding protein FtsE [Caldisericia bacterium]HRV74486.1 cell division ATP-binding protein FtsE [Caldisericia bacterium]